MALIQSVNVLKYANDSVPPASSPSPAIGIQNQLIDAVLPPTAAQLTAYPTAGAAVAVRYFRNAQQFTGQYIVSQTVAAVIAAS